MTEAGREIVTDIVSAEGKELARLTWDNRAGTGHLMYLTPNLDGLSVPITSEALAKATLSSFAERGCSFRVMESE